jgi:hypothetical protein
MEKKSPKLHSNKIGVVLLNKSAHIVSCNDYAASILGLRREDLLGLSPENPCWKAVDFKGKPLKASEHPDMVALKTGQTVKGFIMGLRKQDDQSTIWIEIESTPIFSGSSMGQSPSGALTIFFEVDPPTQKINPKQKNLLRLKAQQELIKKLLKEDEAESYRLKIKTSQLATFLINIQSMRIPGGASKLKQNSLVLEVFLIIMQLHSIEPLKLIPMKHILHSSRFSSRRVMECLHNMKEEGLIDIERTNKEGHLSRAAYIRSSEKLHRAFISLVLELSDIMNNSSEASPSYNGKTLDWDRLMYGKGSGGGDWSQED